MLNKKLVKLCKYLQSKEGSHNKIIHNYKKLKYNYDTIVLKNKKTKR